MSIFQAIFLGIIQGLTELLPVSSSAHLTLIPWIFNWTNSESFNIAFESFDVAPGADITLRGISEGGLSEDRMICFPDS